MQTLSSPPSAASAPISAPTRRAISYKRVSTTDQAGEKHSSLETQDSRTRQWCDQHGAALVQTFTDVASGRKDERREYRRMVEYALAGNADVVIVQFLDRFGRKPREILRRVWELQEAGVTVEATDEDIKEELLLLIKAGIAGQESKRIGERVRANMLTATTTRNVKFGRAPFGYRRIVQPDGKPSFEHDPDEAPAVRHMLGLAVEHNLGYKALGDRMAAGGYRPRRGGWCAETVRRILRNESLRGTLVYRPTGSQPVHIDGFYDPPILEDDEWSALQKRLDIRKEHPRGRTASSDYLLSGVVRCGHCDGPMVGKQRVRPTSNGRAAYRNYVCSLAQRGRSLCAQNNSHSARKLEGAILATLADFEDAAAVAAHLAAAPATDAHTEYAHVERLLEHLDADFAKNLDLLKRGVLDEHDFGLANNLRKTERSKLRFRRAELAAEIEQRHKMTDAVANLPARVRDFRTDAAELEPRLAKPRLQGILKAAYIFRDGRIDLQFRVD